MKNRIQIIAEVKTHSPFGFVSDKSWNELFGVAEEIGDMLSIHTDARWGGSFEILKRARGLSKKPILAKGIHANDDLVRQAIEGGADFVLVVGRIPHIYQKQCIVEPLTLEELIKIPVGQKSLWNSRDLADGSLKKETFNEARKMFPGWLCQASNIRTIGDIHIEANAVLVGTHLIEFADSLLNR